MMSVKMATPGILKITVFWNKGYDLVISAFFKGWSWFTFNNLELALGRDLNFYTSVVKRLELKVRKLWGLISTFVEVTGEKLVV